MRTLFLREKRPRTVALEEREVLTMIARGVAIIFCIHIASSECRKAVRQAVFKSFKINSLEVGAGSNPVKILVKAEFPRKHHPARTTIVRRLEFVKMV